MPPDVIIGGEISTQNAAAIWDLMRSGHYPRIEFPLDLPLHQIGLLCQHDSIIILDLQHPHLFFYIFIL